MDFFKRKKWKFWRRRSTRDEANTTLVNQSRTPEFWLERALDLLCPPLKITNGADKIWSGIYIGDMETAENLEMIRDYEFTHILNCAHSFRHAGQIYDGIDITYMGIQAEDSPFYDMSTHFKSAAEFIDSAVRGGGKVLVHCHAGVSRSATIVLAYLMLKHNMNLSSAIFMVKWSRGILPNVGFLRQLIDLQEELRAH